MRRRDRAGKSVRHVVVYGGSTHGQRFIAALTRQPNPYLAVDAFFDERAGAVPNRIGEIPFGGGADELITYVQRNAIDEIFIALPWSADGRILDILRMFRPLPAAVRLAPESTLLHPALGGDAVLAPTIRHTPLTPWGVFFKSILDRTLAAIALLWFSPLFAGIAVAIKLTSRGPVFFRQNRLGFNNLPFPVYKFRTMRVASSDEQTLKQAQRKDSRVTKIGAFLRRWSIDELPQILNVLKGDMSLVGPRPHPMWRKASDLWEQGGSEPIEAIVHEYAARHRARYAVASSHAVGSRSWSSYVASCSRWETSRTSTFAARWRLIDASSVSPGSSSPPGSAHAPRNGSRARCQRSAWSAPSRTWSTTARVA